MAERRKRRRFTPEFKAQAVRHLLEGGKGLAEVVTDIGIGGGQLSAWRDERPAADSAEALATRKAEQAARGEGGPRRRDRRAAERAA